MKTNKRFNRPDLRPDMKYKVYDKKDEFLGIINGKDERDALREAKLFDMEGAYRVELIGTPERPKITPMIRKKVLMN